MRLVAASVAMLAIAPVSNVAGIAAASGPYMLTDAYGLGPRFDGVGAISGGGATSRLLPDYDPAVLSQILDYLFTPNFGAAFHIFKVEIGGEALATEGSEPTHMRTPDDLSYERGYEWMLLREARKRNPDVLLYGLPWTWPGWVGDAYGRDPWKVNVSLPALYVTKWLEGAAAQGTPVDIIGVWNERPYSPEYVKALRSMLDSTPGLRNVSILCDDGRYLCVPDMLKDPELAAAVAIVGGHGPAPNGAGASTGKPLWFSEDFHAQGGEAGAVTWASQINRRFLQYNMTATIAWNAVDSFLQGLSFDSTGLMTANQPWSGNYQVLGTVWATAQTTQFTSPGMRYLLPNATGGGGGSGWLASGGSYVTYVNATTGDFTLVLEKPSSDPGAAPENARFCLGGSLLQRTAQVGSLRAWYSAFAVQPGQNSEYLVPLPAITPNGPCFNVPIGLNEVVTVTTSRAGARGDHGKPAPAAPFPFPYADDFSSCAPPAEAHYWSDISGAWECVPDAERGVVMQQATPAKPISWERDYRPHTVIGDVFAWSDVNLTIDVRLAAATDTAVVGVRCSLLNQTNYQALMNEISFPGLWLSLNATGGWAVWPSIQALGNWSVPPAAQGTAPTAQLQPGTWHTVSLVASGPQLGAWLDGAQLFTALDVSRLANTSWTGWAGLGTGDYGQHVSFSRFSATAPLAQ